MNPRLLAIALVVCVALSVAADEAEKIRLTPQPSAVPQSLLTPMTLDSVGREVGWGSVRYVLSGDEDDYVNLQVTRDMLRHLGGSPSFSWLYFLDSSDCTGSEAFAEGNVAPIQLTRRQALVVNRFPLAPPPSPPVPIGPLAASELYVTAPFAAPQFLAGPITGASRFNLFTSVCETPPSIFPFGANVTSYTKREDLFAKFTPPFWVAFRH